MRTKKLLSLILTLCLVFTTIGSLGIVNAEDATITETINVAQGAECTLADGTVVDTTYPGYQIITGTDGNTYRVNVGTYGVLLYDDMENHSTTLTNGVYQNKAGTITGGTYSMQSTYDVSKGSTSDLSLRSVTDGTNKVLSMGTESTSWTNKWTLTNAQTGKFRLSFDVKVVDFKPADTIVSNNVAWEMRMYPSYPSILQLRVYSNPTNDTFNGLRLRTYDYQTGTSAVGGEVTLTGIEDIDPAEDTVTTDWFNIEFVMDVTSDKLLYDLYVNNSVVAEDLHLPSALSGSFTGFDIGKRTPNKDTATETQIASASVSDAKTYLDNVKVTDDVIIYPSAINGEELTDSVYSGVKSGTVSVPVTMSDSTTQNFTAAYTLTDEQTATAGTYTVDATIPGFTEKVSVAVTVNESAAANKTINSYIGDTITFPTELDSMSVVWKNYSGSTVTTADTSAIGRKLYTGTIADGREVTYTVNIGTYDEGVGDTMEEHTYKDLTVGTTIIPSLTPVSSDGLTLSLGTATESEPGSVTVKTETVDGEENQYIVIGPEKTKADYTQWSIVEEGYTGGFKISFRMKVDSHTFANKNGIKLNMFNANSKEMGYIYLQLYTYGHAENYLRAYGGATTKNISLNSYIKSDDSGVTGYTDWLDVEIYGGIDSYDAYLNGTKFVDDMPYSNSCTGGDLGKVCFSKRNTKDEYNSVVGLDDLQISRYICYTDELPETLNVTTAVGSNTVKVPLTLSNGSIQQFDVTINSDVSKIANLTNVDAVISSIDGVVNANVKVCNYDVQGVTLKSGNEFISAPIAEGVVESANITRLTDAAASTAIFALYSQGGNIKAIKTVDISSLEKDNRTVVPVGMTLPETTADGDYIRVYVWDSKTNIQPLDMVTDINFNYGAAPTLYIAAASTYETYSRTVNPSQWPKTGIGQVLGNYLSNDVEIINLAKSGSSTHSFISDGLWGRIINDIETGDYVIISFGHNDQVDCTDNTHPDGCVYGTNLQYFVESARAKGGNPIICSPIVRRLEGLAGTPKFNSTTHKHIDQMIDVCTDLEVPYVDMTTLTMNYLLGFDDEGTTDVNEATEVSKNLYMIDLVDNMSYYENAAEWATSRYNPDGKNDTNYSNDNTHFNLYGAKVYTQMLANAIKEQYPDIQLTNYLTNLETTITYPALD